MGASPFSIVSANARSEGSGEDVLAHAENGSLVNAATGAVHGGGRYDASETLTSDRAITRYEELGRGGDSVARMLSVAIARLDPQVVQWLQEAAQTWLNADGRLGFDRCLRLPTTPARVRRARRDLWLSKVVEAMSSDTLWGRCKLAGAMLSAFETRGAWRVWRDRLDPPSGAAGIEAAMFYVLRCSDGSSALSARQIHRVVRSMFAARGSTACSTSIER